ncbi:hypothetical protein CAPTEDRAFT_219638 [Capitella teleta]|uniref:Rho-GAP domain-containing protein n=1 Tax=Capitella teleta TaxID=283909 RepID=R7TMB7_CAPTE|nr:hypothetical protein CAPTEDRAFT_219638 [Capitella teleta]|eukprot:ELT92701.1 hypothetical protein CAPTEDRAFT_219638 [Capitella teleta]
MIIIQIEAVEACRWLRAAGFPQYAQMYEDQGFPIDVTSVEKDHDFLDKDSLQSLFRRLNTLNKCVTMKIEAPPRKMGDDSDEDDQCALSDKWRFQRNSQRWSRKDLIPASSKTRLQSSSSRDSVITDNEGSVSGDSPVTLRQKSSVGIDLNFSEIPQSKAKMSSSGHISDSDTSVGARNFLKRMESFKSRKTRSPKDLSRIQIGQPVLVDTPETQQRIDQLGCIDLTPQLSRKPVENLQKQVREMELQSIAKRSCDHDHFGVSSDHAPGSFPKVLTNGNSVKEQRVSLYDNLSDAEVDLSTVDPQEELDRILQELYQNISGLDATLEMAGQSEPSTIDTTDTSTDKRLSADLDTTVESRERRDSGVGSSLTRRASRIRWHSFIQSHRPLSQSMPLSTLTASQLMLLRKLALLKVTTLMEKHSPSNRSGWNWIMPKFIKRWKTPDYSQQRVFGVPLLLILQRTGQPLPQCILRAMRCLRRTALDAVGIFRKSGVRSRIQKLRNQMESDPDSVDFDTLQSYDVADLLKLYFRELPECLLTNKLSETFISIFTHVPSELRLEAVQSAIMLLPDENRHVLLSLLYFLSDMANHSHVNQMNGSNLAVCFAPSLFNMGASLRPSSNAQSSPKRVRKGTGLPDQKELLDQQAAHQCLTQMIAYCKLLFQVPDDMLSKCRLSCLEEGHAPTLDEIAGNSSSPLLNAQSHLEGIINSMILESKDRSKGWISCSSLSPPTEHSVEVAYKKALDGHPLRLWKACIDVEAPPVELLNRVLRERHLWDEDLLQWRIVEKLSSDLEIFQYQRAGMAPHPTVDMCELRSWKTDLPKGACALVSMSVEHPAATPLGGARGLVLASRFLIEPCGAGMSRLTYISRIDNLGHTTECYNRCYGRLCANQLVAIRNSFSQPLADGPETKV